MICRTVRQLCPRVHACGISCEVSEFLYVAVLSYCSVCIFKMLFECIATQKIVGYCFGAIFNVERTVNFALQTSSGMNYLKRVYILYNS